MEWYYSDNSEQQHTVDESQIPDLVNAGTIQRTTLVWNETMSDWEDAGEIRPDWFRDSPSSSGDSVLAPVTPPATGSTSTGSTNDPLAICSLVFGILSIMCLGPLLGIPAIICGHLARKNAATEVTQSSSRGLALAGLITGYFGTFMWILYFAFGFVVAMLEEFN